MFATGRTERERINVRCSKSGWDVNRKMNKQEHYRQTQYFTIETESHLTVSTVLTRIVSKGKYARVYRVSKISHAACGVFPTLEFSCQQLDEITADVSYKNIYTELTAPSSTNTFAKLQKDPSLPCDISRRFRLRNHRFRYRRIRLRLNDYSDIGMFENLRKMITTSHSSI